MPVAPAPPADDQARPAPEPGAPFASEPEVRTPTNDEPEAPSGTSAAGETVEPPLAATWTEPYAAARVEPWSPDIDPWTIPDVYDASDDGADAPVATEPFTIESTEAPSSAGVDAPREPITPAEDEESEAPETPEEPTTTADAPAAATGAAARSPWVPPASIRPAWSVTDAPAWPAAEPLPVSGELEDGGPAAEDAALDAGAAVSDAGAASVPADEQATPDESTTPDDRATADDLATADEIEAAAEPDEAAAEPPDEPLPEAPQRRSWWRPAAAPVWPPEPEDAEASADAAPDTVDTPAAASDADAGRAPFDAPEAPPESDWPIAAESTQVLPPSWRAPRPEPGPPSGELRPSGAPVRTRLGTAEPEARPEPGPSTAEQAVPWLIGVILLLAGMVIVLLALIFAGDGSLGGAVVGPSPSDGSLLPSASVLAGPVLSSTPPTPTPAASSSPSGDPTPTPMPMPEYGPLEMVYQGRSQPLAHIYLLHRDFTTADEPEVLAQDQDLDVRQFAWAPDGTVGVALYADLLVSVEPGREKRVLGDEISTATFGADAGTVYAARVTEDGDNDVATLLQVDFATGDSSEITAVSYARPDVGGEDPLPEAKFIDEGGPIRLFRLEDGTLRLWVLGGGAWDVDPAAGEASQVDEGALPTLWSPKGNRRVAAEEADGTTTLTLRNRDDEVMATTSVEGLVSHLRWSPKGDMVVFTVGTSASGGGVIQNLWVWYLEDGVAPTQMTDTGAAFGAEWMGSPALWRP